MPGRWEKIKELVEAGLEREGAVRTRFLDEACAGDVALRQRVERLLAAHEKTVGIVDEMAGPAGSPDGTRLANRTRSGAEAAQYSRRWVSLSG